MYSTIIRYINHQKKNTHKTSILSEFLIFLFNLFLIGKNYIVLARRLVLGGHTYCQ